MPRLTPVQALVVRRLQTYGGWLKVWYTGYGTRLLCRLMEGNHEVETVDTRVFRKLVAAGIVRQSRKTLPRRSPHPHETPQMRYDLTKEYRHAENHN